MSAIYKFPYDSPVRYLPLVYMLPHDLLIRCPILRKLPRSMGELNASPEWAEVIQSDTFLNEVMDAVASLAFPHFGFGGWKEHYTGWCPIWRPTPCPCGPKGWSVCGAGVCNPCSACRPTSRYPFLTRRMSRR